MTREEFIKVLDEEGYSYKEEGDKIEVNHQGNVYLDSLTTLPEGVEFSNSGNLYLNSLTNLPKGIVFSNSASVNLRLLKTLPEGTEFSNGSYVDLESLTSIPEGIVFSNEGDVDLKSLTVYLGYLIGGWFSGWKGNIEGIGSNRLLNKMISDGLFNRK